MLLPHNLIDRALVAVHRRHHALQDGIEELPGLFRVAIRQQFHGALRSANSTVTRLRSPSRALRE